MPINTDTENENYIPSTMTKSVILKKKDTSKASLRVIAKLLEAVLVAEIKAAGIKIDGGHSVETKISDNSFDFFEDDKVWVLAECRVLLTHEQNLVRSREISNMERLEIKDLTLSYHRAPDSTRTQDIELVCEKAFAWARECGFRDAEEVWDAAVRLAPHLESEWI